MDAIDPWRNPDGSARSVEETMRLLNMGGVQSQLDLAHSQLSHVLHVDAHVVQSPTISDPERIALLGERVERSFENFSEPISRALAHRRASGETDPLFERVIQSPFQTIRGNRENQHSNAAILKKEAAQRATELVFVSNEKLTNPYHFLYDIDAGESAAVQGIAGFSPAERRMVLPEQFNPDDPLDFLVVCHETAHVLHAADWLKKDARSFFEFHLYGQPKPAVVLQEELDAYAIEIEMLNLLLHDQLRQSISSGRPIDRQVFARQLGIVPGREPLLQMLLDLARQYYPSGKLSTSAKPPAFSRAVSREKQAGGFHLFERTPNGLPRQIPSQQ